MAMAASSCLCVVYKPVLASGVESINMLLFCVMEVQVHDDVPCGWQWPLVRVCVRVCVRVRFRVLPTNRY